MNRISLIIQEEQVNLTGIGLYFQYLFSNHSLFYLGFKKTSKTEFRSYLCFYSSKCSNSAVILDAISFNRTY